MLKLKNLFTGRGMFSNSFAHTFESSKRVGDGLGRSPLKSRLAGKSLNCKHANCQYDVLSLYVYAFLKFGFL